MMTAAELAKALGGRKQGRGWRASCPAHDDHDPSFAISETDGGKVLFHCLAGCSQDAVQAALRARGLWGGKDVAHIKPDPDLPRQRLAARLRQHLREGTFVRCPELVDYEWMIR